MKYPKIEELNNILNEIKGIKFPKFNNESSKEYVPEVDKVLFDKIKFFFGIMTSFKTNPELRLFKVRPLSGFQDRIYDYNEHTYVPKEYCTLQRANYKNEPVLYCAEHPSTAILEVVKNNFNSYQQEQKHFIVSSWEFTDYTDVKFASFLDGNFDTISHFKDNFENTKITLSETYTNNDVESFVKLYNEYASYISSLFLTNSDKYHISAYFAYNYLYRGELKADAIIFPSIQIQKRAVNYAIRTDIVDSKMKIKNLYHIFVNSIDFQEELIDISLYAIGTLKGKNITWIEVDKDNINHDWIFKQFHKDFGENV